MQDNLKIYSICVAYEQGVGKGRSDCCKQTDNPYCDKTDKTNGFGYEHQAWDYGWQEGDRWLTQRIKQPIKRKIISDCGPV